jgi:hypothetical protein
MRVKMWVVKRENKIDEEEQRHNILPSQIYSCLNSFTGIDSRMNHLKEGGNDRNYRGLEELSKEGEEKSKPQLMTSWIRSIFKKFQVD